MRSIFPCSIKMKANEHSGFHKKEQTFCGLKGLVLEDTPVSRGSCKAFCMQNCWRSAAAWETFTLFMLASKRSCCTTFFMATRLDEPDILGVSV